MLISRSERKLEQLLIDTGLPEGRVLTTAADVTQGQCVKEVVDTVVEYFGRLDVLLNTVGGWGGGQTVAEISVEDWNGMLALNLHSAFLLSRAVLPHMLGAGWGRIIHVSSKAAVQPRPKQAGYGVAKMGLIALTEAIAAETKSSGVTANVILPSIIDTPDNRANMPKSDPSKWVPPQRIAAAMRFLCSDAAASINGARIEMYGAV
jgi:NAD(P)-dependent dehydrogenase (short-subunit alcohol dehydrogenase family)